MAAGSGQTAVTLYPVGNYNFGVKAPIFDKDATFQDALARMQQKCAAADCLLQERMLLHVSVWRQLCVLCVAAGMPCSRATITSCHRMLLDRTLTRIEARHCCQGSNIDVSTVRASRATRAVGRRLRSSLTLVSVQVRAGGRAALGGGRAAGARAPPPARTAAAGRPRLLQAARRPPAARRERCAPPARRLPPLRSGRAPLPNHLARPHQQ